MAGPDELTRVAQGHLEQWELRPDGAARQGVNSLIQPVRTSDGVAAVLKVGGQGPASEHEHLVLRRWAGDGAVRLLRADPPRRVVLLERLHTDDLHDVSDAEACEVVAGLLRRINVPALPQLRSLSSDVEQWVQDFEELARSAPIPRRLVEQAIALSADLVADPVESSVLHGNLHYGNVLAAEREPWLAIAPQPVNGDPHYELAPMLLHRWDDFGGRIRDGVRTRLYTIVDATGLDEERARAWVLVRVVHQAAVELNAPGRTGPADLTRLVTLAKAVQD